MKTFSRLRTLSAIAVLISLPGLTPAAASDFFYSYDDGAAALEVDRSTGTIKRHEALAQEPLVPNAKKLAADSDGKSLLISADDNKNVVVVETGLFPKVLNRFAVSRETGAVRSWDDKAILAAAKGAFYLVDLKTGKVVKTWNSRKALSPSGHRGEDILLLPEKNLALISFQKDSKSGKHLGSRIVVFDLGAFRSLHDLQLPRSRPELHMEGTRKEQGPNPEVVLAAPKSDTLAVTADLYGAVAFCKLSAALRGKLEDFEYVSTAPDGSWGRSFPDRACMFEVGGREYLLVSNASKDGGLALFDVKERKVLQTFPASAGCETPVFLPEANKVVTSISGKIKARGNAKLNKNFRPENDLLVFDVAPLAQDGEVELERISLDGPITHVQAIASDENNRLLLVLGESANQIALYDLTSREIIHREPAKGTVSRILAWGKK